MLGKHCLVVCVGPAHYMKYDAQYICMIYIMTVESMLLGTHCRVVYIGRLRERKCVVLECSDYLDISLFWANLPEDKKAKDISRH